jgi:arylformamidase
MLQHLEFLEIRRRVPARRENEVSFSESARVPKDALHIPRRDRHRDYSAGVKIHDVSLVLRPEMVTWPSEPSPRIEPLRRIAKGDTANVSVLTISDHAGTHVDPPLHFIEGGNTGDKLPLEALIGPCVVLTFDGPGHVSGEWLDGAKLPRGTERILFKTPNSARWSDPKANFTRDFTTINASAARWCVARGLKVVGIDYLSIEPQGPEKEGYPVHKTLLAANVVIIEGLDLSGVEAGEYELVCAPIKLLDGDGAPARVFLIER